MRQSRKAAAAIIAAGVLWGAISLPVRQLSDCGLTPIQVTFVRLITAATLLTAFTAVKSPSLLRFRLRDIWMFIGTGIISIVLFNCCYFFAMIHGEASVAVVLLYTSPIFIMLISRVMFEERITMIKVIALIMTIFGCICVSGFIGSGAGISVTVFLAGIGSGLFYGLYTIFGKLALRRYSSMTVTVYTFIFGAAGSLPLCFSGGDVIAAFTSSRGLLSTFAIGIFCTLLPYCLYTYGLKYAEAGKAAILVAVEPLVGAVIGMTLLGEKRDVLKITGIVLILAAIIMLSMPADHKKHIKENK